MAKPLHGMLSVLLPSDGSLFRTPTLRARWIIAMPFSSLIARLDSYWIRFSFRAVFGGADAAPLPHE